MELQIVFIILMAIGVGLIIFSIIPRKKRYTQATSIDVNSSVSQPIESNAIDERHALLDDTLTKADKAIKDINELSEYVLSEIEKKYRELLFVYQLIDEKKEQVSEDKKEYDNLTNRDEYIDTKETKIQYETKELEREAIILEMYQKGNCIQNIAKELNVGVGEVKLIIDLSKIR